MDRTEPGNNFARTQLRVCKYLQGSAIPANIERHLFLHRHRRHEISPRKRLAGRDAAVEAQMVMEDLLPRWMKIMMMMMMTMVIMII